MKERSYKTAEGREAARKEINEAIASLKAKLEPEKDKQYELISHNKVKIDTRASLNQQMNSRKSTGKTIIIVGAIAVAIGAISALAFDAGLGGIIGVCIGILGIALGIVTFNGWKKYLPEFNEVDKELSDFDKTNSSLSNTICEYEKRINELEDELIEISLAEKYEKVDNWIDSISTGHVLVYASSEHHLFEPSPREPKAMLYDSHTLSKVQIYVNDMLYGSINGQYKKRNIDVFEVDETGTQKTEFVVTYRLGDNYFTYETAPMPVKFDQKSLFCWFHVSTCQEGTKVYAQSYHSFDAFLEETGITKAELMNLFL